MFTVAPPESVIIREADGDDLERIFEARHEVYARELGQHATNATGRLTDTLDGVNAYIVARAGARLLGFVSITPPTVGRYSIDKYFARAALPFSLHPRTHEVRLLTLTRTQRGSSLGSLLMWAALRWIEERGGTHVIALGRTPLLPFYEKVGLERTGVRTHAGAVSYELVHAPTDRIRAAATPRRGLLRRALRRVAWRLAFAPALERPCHHGGAFFAAVGEDFRDLRRRAQIINADVLDAWFDPAPRVLAALAEHLPWLTRTSPPTHARGLIQAIAAQADISPASVLVGAGSSALLYDALPRWIQPDSRALILDPTYGEYPHLLERVIGCRVERFPLNAEENFATDVAALAGRIAAGVDWVVLVNPNSPTGGLLSAAELRMLIDAAPRATRFWIDETYIDYCGRGESLEQLAADSPRVVVCKSMSKVYALSGMRVAYLCGHPAMIDELRRTAPPWAVGLPAQVAAVEALRAQQYYAARHDETRTYREELVCALRRIPGLSPLTHGANFVLVKIDEADFTSADLVERCRGRGLYLRDITNLSPRLEPRYVRIAVKDRATNQRMCEILEEAIRKPDAAFSMHGAAIGARETAVGVRK